MVRKATLLLICGLVLSGFAFSSEAVAQDNVFDRKFGFGLMVGEPTGLSVKLWDNNRNAFDGGLAWTFAGDDALSVHADYLWHNYTLFDEVEKGLLPVYFGVGGRLVFSNDSRLGVRVPVGINYIPQDAPLDLFFELAPIVDLVPNAEADFSAAAGVRVYL
ncbi:MAG: hypothetical protein R3211_12240 [Balneolaceae bacterium]|nr:hypothetical protein [Balneolaceae bacterium]